MICIGILSVRKEKAGLLRKVFFPVSVKDRFQTEVCVIVAELAFTADEIQCMTEKRRAMLNIRAVQFLKKSGADEVIYTKSCTAAFGVKEERMYTGEGIPKERFAECLDFAMSKIGIDSIKQSVYIRDSKMTAINYGILEVICQKVRYINLLTENTEEAENIGERLYKEYGVYPEIQSIDCKIPASAVIAADADKGIIRIGQNYIIDGIERELDLHGYDVDVNAALECMGEEKDKLSFKSWLSGKKRLTR